MGNFTFDGHKVPFEEGDTVGAALHRRGVKVLSRSLKYHRPRGLFCNQGSCGSCLVDVDGIPNTTACTALCKDGAVVRSQNRLGSARHDLFGLTDKVFWDGFDPHDAFTRPRWMNALFLRAVRFMSGLGRPPKPGTHLEGPRRHMLAVDELVIGAGSRGIARAITASNEGKQVLLVDEARVPGGSARWHPLEVPTRTLAASLGKHPSITVWTGSTCFGLYPGETGPLAAIARPGPAPDAKMPDLWEVTAKRITLALGGHDAWPLFPNNDLPGVLSLRGAIRLLGEHGVRPGWTVVVHGERLPPGIGAWFQNAGIQVVAQGKVTEARGGVTIEAAKVNNDWVGCDTILSNLPGTPRVELYQQAGCKLDWSRGVLGPAHDATGATNVPGVFVATEAHP